MEYRLHVTMLLRLPFLFVGLLPFLFLFVGTARWGLILIQTANLIEIKLRKAAVFSEPLMNTK